MTKLRKFLKVGLPIIAASAVGVGAITSIALSTKHTASIDKNLQALNKVAAETGIEQNLTWDLPSIANGWGRIALTPTYSSSVIEKFGAVYAPDKNNVKWPRLIANSVSAENARVGKVDKTDLITFDQLIPNETLSRILANGICRTSVDSTVLEWREDENAPNGGFWINHLAQFNAKWDRGIEKKDIAKWDHSIDEYGEEGTWRVKSEYITEFVGSSIFYIASKYSGSQSTTTNPDRLLSSVLMNPFVYDSDAYNYSDEKNHKYFIFEPAYSHIYKWWLDSNEFSTLPRGLFQHIYLYHTDPKYKYIKEEDDGVIIDFESNNISNLNPLQLFGSRIQTEEGIIESWDERQDFGPGFGCDIYLDVAKTLINYSQNSWQMYAGNLDRNGYKYGWNLSKDSDYLYTWTANDEGENEYCFVNYQDGITPDIGPLPRYTDLDQPWLDPRNYGLGTSTKRISETVMYALTNGFKKNDIWASNMVIPIVLNTNKCLAEMNWISVPMSTKFLSSGVSDDMAGTCNINIARSGISVLDINTSFEISGFNEATSGLILSILLTIIFVLALTLSINKVYRNYHPKLTKDELKMIHEVNSTNRLNKIRKLAEEKERASKEESQK